MMIEESEAAFVLFVVLSMEDGARLYIHALIVFVPRDSLDNDPKFGY